MSSTILVVDDSEVDRCLIGGLLRKQPGYLVEMVSSAQGALHFTSERRVDLVITDLVMPGLDGLGLVRSLSHSHPDLPVILMTAFGNETTAVEALKTGAVSYVPKACKAERLVDTVATILDHARADRSIGRLAQSTLEYKWRLALDNDPELIPLLLRQIQAMLASVAFAGRVRRIRVVEAFKEALLNAIYHGNLAISERELAEARTDFAGERLRALVAERRSQPECCARKVLVVMHLSATEARFVIRDEGNGYVVSSNVENAAESSFRNGQRRGLTLIQTLMDDVWFNGRGNELGMCTHSVA